MKWDGREGIKNIKNKSIEIIQFEEEKGKMRTKMRLLGKDEEKKKGRKISEKIMAW